MCPAGYRSVRQRPKVEERHFPSCHQELILIPGTKFVALPMAKGGDKGRKRELQFRVTVVDSQAERLKPQGIDWGKGEE